LLVNASLVVQRAVFVSMALFLRSNQPRMRTTEQHVSFLDSIRGVAVLAVFLYHSLGSAFLRFHLPWAGVVQDPRGAGVFALFYPLDGHTRKTLPIRFTP